MKKFKKRYKIIPFNEITEEARDIAVLWVENYKPMGMNLEQKHKLASDIMNYTKSILSEKDLEIEKLKKDLWKIRSIVNRENKKNND